MSRADPLSATKHQGPQDPLLRTSSDEGNGRASHSSAADDLIDFSATNPPRSPSGASTPYNTGSVSSSAHASPLRAPNASLAPRSILQQQHSTPPQGARKLSFTDQHSHSHQAAPPSPSKRGASSHHQRPAQEHMLHPTRPLSNMSSNGSLRQQQSRDSLLVPGAESSTIIHDLSSTNSSEDLSGSGSGSGSSQRTAGPNNAHGGGARGAGGDDDGADRSNADAASQMSFKRRAARRRGGPGLTLGNTAAEAGATTRPLSSISFSANPPGSGTSTGGFLSALRNPIRRIRTFSNGSRNTRNSALLQQQSEESRRSRINEALLAADAGDDTMGGAGGGGGGGSKLYAPPLIPSVQPDQYSTPIPTLPFLVLCITVFSEFCAAGVAGPFLFFMIEDFDLGGGEASVGFWAGIVASAFFFAQFLTSMLWASIAEKHGRRIVLLTSLVGNSITLCLFGASKNLPTALAIRLAQGLFNGAVGVAKGGVRDLTDETNEGRAYATMGFWWGMGGIVGPILGGLLEHPARKYPSLFGENEFLQEYPYILPCMVASCLTAAGAFLSLFIGPDGGPREGSIYLPEKVVDIERASQSIGSLGRSAGKRISGYFSNRPVQLGDTTGPGPHDESALDFVGPSQDREGASSRHTGNLPRTFTQQVDDETGGPPSPSADGDYTITTANPTEMGRPRGMSDASAWSNRYSRTDYRRQGILAAGSAYGYERRGSRSSALRPAIASYGATYGQQADDRPRSLFHGSQSGITNNPYAPDFETLGQPKPELNFAQRFLLANDDAVLSLTDLWVAAATNGDDAYSTIEEDVFDEDDDDQTRDAMDDESRIESSVVESDLASEDGERSPLLAPRHLPPLNFAQRKWSRGAGSDTTSNSFVRPRMARKSSSGTRVPSIYSNTGLERPTSPLGMLSPPLQQNPPLLRTPTFDPSLANIPESRRVSVSGSPERSDAATVVGQAAKPASIWSMLPLVIIAHYGIMSWSSSAFDQVFMGFLVTPFASGGLGLTAAHFAELIAAMAVCQMYFQFYWFPFITGKFSQVTVWRIGLAMYLPCYTLFPFLRNFLHPSTDVTVMSGMILFAAFRYLANVTAFTSISILINASCLDPKLVPLANGLAQTTSSAARSIGPIIGGMVWAQSIKGGPDAHSWPFNYHLGFWMVGLVSFAGFLHSWTIR